MLYSIFTFNNGEIRLFMFIGVILGTIIYLIFVSSYIIKINVTIISFLKNIITKIAKIIIAPFKFIYKILKKTLLKPFSFIIINIRNFSTNIFKKIDNPFKNTQKTQKQ